MRQGQRELLVLPSHLYDPKDSLVLGGSGRAAGHLMRQRALFLLAEPAVSIGLRRAMHAVALCDSTVRHQDESTGLFDLELKTQVLDRLVATKATLQAQEKHFADREWWKQLDGEQLRDELRSNLQRLLKDELTPCLLVGIELQVLLHMYLTYRFGGAYKGVITQRELQQHATLTNSWKSLSRTLAYNIAA